MGISQHPTWCADSPSQPILPPPHQFCLFMTFFYSLFPHTFKIPLLNVLRFSFTRCWKGLGPDAQPGSLFWKQITQLPNLLREVRHKGLNSNPATFSLGLVSVGGPASLSTHFLITVTFLNGIIQYIVLWLVYFAQHSNWEICICS